MAYEDQAAGGTGQEPGTEREPAHVGAAASDPEPAGTKRSGNGGNGNGNGGNGKGDDGNGGNRERPGLVSRVGPRARRGATGSPASDRGTVRKVRDLVATAVLTVAVLAALVLALGAVLVGLNANVDNSIVSGVLGLANRLDGPFADVFTFSSAIKQTLINWGIAAAVYLIAGRLLERIIRP